MEDEAPPSLVDELSVVRSCLKKQLVLCVLLTIALVLDVLEEDVVVRVVAITCYAIGISVAAASLSEAEIKSVTLWGYLLHVCAYPFLLGRYIAYLTATRQ